MRIGELLLQHGWVDAGELARVAAELRAGGPRLCSLLIARGALDPDDASRALGEQHGVAAALQKHLAYRDRSLAPLLNGRFARGRCVLPIGHQRDGTLVLAVRDPGGDLPATLQRALGGKLVIAVAPATQLEQLVTLMYPPENDTSDEESYDVDLRTGPISLDFGNLALVDLDDQRVAKDPTQSGTHTLPALPRTITGSAVPAPKAIPLEATVAAITGASARDDMTDLAMRYAQARWSSALLLTIKEGTALGHRGHGGQLTAELIQAITFPLAAPSLVKAAYDAADVVLESRPGAIQERLVRFLGAPKQPAAAGVRVGTKVACVLVVGDALASEMTSTQDLHRLVTVLGEGYARIVREAKR